jgi:glycosyltransferase involved in cell wall biosynthesis
MLGWEFPPYISGGLGTACYGLTKAFILPRAIGAQDASHVKLLTPQAPRAVAKRETAILEAQRPGEPIAAVVPVEPGMENVTFHAVPSRLANPYQSAGGQVTESHVTVDDVKQQSQPNPNEPLSVLRGPGGGDHYHGDIVSESQRYAENCLRIAATEDFDVIHAHDWMTFPAGLMIAAATGKPLVVHVHSTEYDRSGDHMNSFVYDIERRGMLGAIRIIAVSHFTKQVLMQKYGIDATRIDVVYNGIEMDDAPRNGAGKTNGAAEDDRNIHKSDKIVLFLGRITMQKGPEYFVAAAKMVLEKISNVKFIMAGTGDMVRDVIELAAAEGIGHKVLFTGFLRGADVQKVFQMADVYVMPSVSEPFGIAPLEAIRHDVPVIISKTSGVAEVLNHALKVDFWDTREIANKIIAVLRHAPLSSTLREHADIEVRRLTWDDAARKCLRVYENAAELMPT